MTRLPGPRSIQCQMGLNLRRGEARLPRSVFSGLRSEGFMRSVTRIRLRNSPLAGFTNLREGQRWPVEQPMEGWLQWEGRVLPVIPVKIANFSAGGVAIWVDPKLDLCPGGHGVLITQAHGRGCGYRPVKGCWQVKGANRSLVGLAFER